MSIVQGSSVAETLSSAVSALSANGFGVDYFEYVDLPAMAPIAAHQSDSALICAAKLGTTRLIDNVVFIG
jgi:pantothenate synthetase